MRIACGTLLASLLLVGGLPGQGPDKQGSEKDRQSDYSPTSYGGKTLPQWIKELDSEDASLRSQAVAALPNFGDRAADAVPALLGRLQDRDVSPRARAVMVLREITIAEKDVPRVVVALARRISPQNESQACVRYEAIVTLRRFMGDAMPAVPALISATIDKSSWELRYISVQLLWRVGLENNKEGGPDPRITEALLNLLRWDKSYQVRVEVLMGLGALGRPANPTLRARVISELNLCARHKNKPLALWAYAGLVAMEDGPAARASLEALARFLKSDSLEVRVQAVQAIGALRDRARTKLPALLAMLQDKEPVAVQAACTALGSLGDKSDSVLDALLGLTSNKDPLSAAAAITALVNLKANTTRVVTTLDKMREKKDLDLRLRGLIEEALKELKKVSKK